MLPGIVVGCPAVSHASDSADRVSPLITAAARPRREGRSMPFCTQCGHSNADDARFCSNCGAALDAPRARRTDALGGGRPRRSRSQGVDLAAEAAEKAEGLSAADQAAVDALPPGSALLVVQRGPNAGSRFLLDADVDHGRPPPGQRHLPRRRHRVAPARGVPSATRDGFAVRDVGSLNGTYVNRRADRRGRARRRRRGADRQVPAGLLPEPARHAVQPRGGERGESAAPRRSLMSIGEVLGQLRAEFPDVTISKIRFLESEGLVEPAAHAVGLPQVHPRRRRAAALRARRRSATTTCRCG